jgi:hypothetical protein
MRRILLTLILGATAAGCASSRAQVVEDQPTLIVPPVPPRSIEPPPPTEPPAIEPVPDIPPPSTPPVKPKPTVTRNSSEPRPDQARPEPPVQDATATSSVPNPAPVAPLRTPTTPSAPQIKEILDRASVTLNTRVDYQKLSDDGKANYNQAKAYIDQAGEALKKEDLALAKSYADRAENIAKQLATGR